MVPSTVLQLAVATAVLRNLWVPRCRSGQSGCVHVWWHIHTKVHTGCNQTLLGFLNNKSFMNVQWQNKSHLHYTLLHYSVVFDGNFFSYDTVRNQRELFCMNVPPYISSGAYWKLLAWNEQKRFHSSRCACQRSLFVLWPLLHACVSTITHTHWCTHKLSKDATRRSISDPIFLG